MYDVTVDDNGGDYIIINRTVIMMVVLTMMIITMMITVANYDCGGDGGYSNAHNHQDNDFSGYNDDNNIFTMPRF